MRCVHSGHCKPWSGLCVPHISTYQRGAPFSTPNHDVNLPCEPINPGFTCNQDPAALAGQGSTHATWSQLELGFSLHGDRPPYDSGSRRSILDGGCVSMRKGGRDCFSFRILFLFRQPKDRRFVNISNERTLNRSGTANKTRWLRSVFLLNLESSSAECPKKVRDANSVNSKAINFF